MTVIVDKAKCIGCGACVAECPVEAIDLVDGLAVVDPKKCNDLGKCVEWRSLFRESLTRIKRHNTDITCGFLYYGFA